MQLIKLHLPMINLTSLSMLFSVGHLPTPSPIWVTLVPRSSPRSRMRLRSTAGNNNATDGAVIAVVGGAIMDMVFEVDRMPEADESLDASSLTYKPGG